MGVGSRMKLSFTRHDPAALNGELDKVNYNTMPVFGLAMPKSCPGVPSGNSQSTKYLEWQERIWCEGANTCSFVREEFPCSICRVCEWWNSERSAKALWTLNSKEYKKPSLKRKVFLPHNLSTQGSYWSFTWNCFSFQRYISGNPLVYLKKKVNTFYKVLRTRSRWSHSDPMVPENIIRLLSIPLVRNNAIHILREENTGISRSYHLHVAIAQQRIMNIRMVSEKGTEIGMDEITPWFAGIPNDVNWRLNAWIKFSVAALKQCGTGKNPDEWNHRLP